MDPPSANEPRLLIPQLRPFYRAVAPLSWLLVRLTVGLMLIPHGWPKVEAGVAATASSALARRGIQPAEPLAILLIVLETIGGICIALGLFTRFFAAGAAVEMLIITWLYWKAGFSWLNRGYEYTLLWGLVCFAIALRGGGPYSLDRKLGVQL
jgi:putative oxidoreductase